LVIAGLLDAQCRYDFEKQRFYQRRKMDLLHWRQDGRRLVLIE
jgi:hypothetical protein